MVLFLTSMQTTFIIISAVIVGILILSFVIVILRRNIESKQYHELYYRSLYKTAVYKDFYLINNFKYETESNNENTIDHILFGDKYIYLILDKYYYGDIMGKGDDQSLILVPQNGKKCYTDNPLNLISNDIKDIKTLMGLEDINMMGLVVVNNDCYPEVSEISTQLQVVRARKLKKLINTTEERDVPKINQDTLKSIVDKFDSMNRKEK